MKKTFLLLLISSLALTFSSTYGQSNSQTGDHKADTVKCAGITSKGQVCRSSWIEPNGYCRNHNPNKVLCSGTTVKNEPCKRVVSNTGDLCATHSKLSAEELAKFPNYKKADKEYGQDNRFSDQWCELAAKVN